MDITRRDFLKVVGILAAGLSTATGCAPLAQYLPGTGARLTDLLKVSAFEWLALNRLTFGPRPEERQRFLDMGLSGFLEEQLAPQGIPDYKADLLISLHTGGSMVHSTSGIFIYHYQDFAGNPPKLYENKLSRAQDKTAPILWDQAQSRHLEKSRVLARLLNHRLNDSRLGKESRVLGAPVLLLQGANMPAILIEIGYLTNPAEGKRLSDQRFLTDLAKEISQGIDEYFEQEQ